MWVSLFAVHFQQVADALLAPFTALGTIAGTGALAGAVAGRLEALQLDLSASESDAHVQASYYEGLVGAAAVGFWPFAILLASAIA